MIPAPRLFSQKKRNDEAAAELIADGKMTADEYRLLVKMCRAGIRGLPPSLERRMREQEERAS